MNFHRSVNSSAPSILPPRVRVPIFREGIISKLFKLFNRQYNDVLDINELP